MNFKSKYVKITGIIVFLLVLACGILAWMFFKNNDGSNVEKHHIPVSMALDDGYTYPTIVAITSMMETKNSDTAYDYYIMHPGEFSQESKDKLVSLEKKYKDCKINLIDMADKYKNANDKGHITTPTYYRLSLPDLLPDLDRILWVDGDTLTLEDLTPMYNIDMENYYYRGLLDPTVNGTETFGVDNDHCICAGVMVINLAELRRDDMVNKSIDFIEKNNDKLIQHDQTVINVLCADKIGVLPPKYGIFNYYTSEKDLTGYYESLRSADRYTMEELVDALNHPALLHCVVKPWKDRGAFRFDWWWKYARKSDYYNEMAEKYLSAI